jgi:DNA-binding response OmpR family regulator
MKKILIIEDDINLRLNLAELLRTEEFEVYEASNGKSGIELAKKVIPNLIICDWMMPELNGSQVLKLLKQCPYTNRIPFIFLTAKSDKMDVVKGISQGANDYIIKPYSAERLLIAINKFLSTESA